ncbi:uncharacterized protein ARMOST_07130 [Armillaria ostoyae]|uniref:Uncharacterized protein n=1 Tax=Armillaria ostoyae TaxID=47428 RepID=A0A284R511_ARMOS|nr:uncharacterized protein ARMOST_07130 [Armillaria ostoyae]
MPICSPEQSSDGHTFYTSGGPKSPGLRASHPHQPCKPSNEAAPCACSNDDYNDCPTVDDNDDDQCSPRREMQPESPPTSPSPLVVILVPIAPVYEALGILGGGLLCKEILWEKHRRVGDIEEEGGTKIGTPTAHGDDDGHTLLRIDGGVEGTTNVPTIIVIRQFSRPPLPAPPNTNIDVPRPMQPSQGPHIRISPIILVGEYESFVLQDPRLPGRRASAPSPPPTSSPPSTGFRLLSIPFPSTK